MASFSAHLVQVKQRLRPGGGGGALERKPDRSHPSELSRSQLVGADLSQLDRKSGPIKSLRVVLTDCLRSNFLN